MDVDKLLEIISNSRSAVFFGGAGVSTASGIPDFRSANGLYTKYRSISPEEIISHSFFMSNTKEFYNFYLSKMVYPDAKPNYVHKCLAKLEEKGMLRAVITQNIDGLHQMAGSKRVVELHGSTLRNYCMKCGKFFDVDYVLSSKGLPTCDKCGGIVKPDVVLYEENLDEKSMLYAEKFINDADTLIVGGTSLTVYPAAGFLQFFRGQNLVVINKSDTQADKKADLVIHDDLNAVFKAILGRIE